MKGPAINSASVPAAVPSTGRASSATRHEYNLARMALADRRAQQPGSPLFFTRYYHRRLQSLYTWLIPPGQRVLALGCGFGDVLAACAPAVGVGVDFSAETLRAARERHPGLRFVHSDAHDIALGETFDYIILSDIINDAHDVQAMFDAVRRHSTPRTRLIVNFHSHLWQLPVRAARGMGLARPQQLQNWLTPDDVRSLLSLSGFEEVRSFTDFLYPTSTPLLADFCNRYLAKIWPFSIGAMTHVVIARPLASRLADSPYLPETRPPKVTVVVPARNETGNIDAIVKDLPEMGRGTEIIFVEGGSTDDTYGAIERAMADNPTRDCRLFKQTGKGKGDAVRLGFAKATGDILMIYDADRTVPASDLPRFYDALVNGSGEFINGCRLIYPMQDEAMRFLNLIGNRFFSVAFRFLLGQPIKDTLCGTKVLRKDDYEKIAANRAYFGDFDPFGDFDLLFGAAKLNHKIVDLPIRYGARTYGQTNISRWRHGVLLLRMVVFAARRLKFV